MAFRFFSRIRLAPGLSLNLSKRDGSFSFGPRGAKITAGTSGVRRTVSLPGTGLWYTGKVGDRRRGGSAQGRGRSGSPTDHGELEASDLIRDCDTKFTKQFDSLLKAGDVRIHRKGPAQPNMNAYAERFVQTIQQEPLDHFVILGEKHLNHIISEYLVHYHEERTHQALGN